MGILWSIIVGFIVGVVAKLITPGRSKPSGFILTTVLGIVGALLATWIGQGIGWYGPGDTAASSPRSSARSWCCSPGRSLPGSADAGDR